jgi:topoisomerase IA-like protein
VNNGRFGPYVRFGKTFISLPKGEDPLDVSLERAQELIDEKNKPMLQLLMKAYSKRCWSFWSFYQMERNFYQCK